MDSSEPHAQRDLRSGAFFSVIPELAVNACLSEAKFSLFERVGEEVSWRGLGI